MWLFLVTHVFLLYSLDYVMQGNSTAFINDCLFLKIVFPPAIKKTTYAENDALNMLPCTHSHSANPPQYNPRASMEWNV